MGRGIGNKLSQCTEGQSIQYLPGNNSITMCGVKLSTAERNASTGGRGLGRGGLRFPFGEDRQGWHPSWALGLESDLVLSLQYLGISLVITAITTIIESTGNNCGVCIRP